MSLSTNLEKNDSTANLLPQASSRFPLVKKILNTNLLPILSVAAAVSTGLVGVAALNTWNVYRSFETAINSNFRLKELSGQIVHLDEVLTMSARMAASTGSLSWEERYLENVPPLDSAITEVLTIAPEYQENASQTDQANAKLIEMEERAFELVRQGNAPQALELLLSQEYNTQKQIYSSGIEATLASIKSAVNEQIQTYSRQLSQSAILAGVSFPFLLLSWIAVLSLIRAYIQERNSAQSSLEQLNQNLEQRVEQRTQQLLEREQTSRQESEVLQEDVSQILDVVSTVEEGNFNVQAPVNDRVTGLVCDTLNRLIEELANVLRSVLQAAGQVSQGVRQLEGMAHSVAENSQQEARAVTQVLDLTNQVEQSALDSAAQIETSTASLQSLQKSVEKGQEASAALINGISILQEGTDRIVQQMKTLGEFVGLTDQFLQEQSQISNMTQVLAMNASLVAARASEQKDPTQFVVVAREFESIANQVSNLAQRNSSGLVSLEQRSSQIHSVVSSIDANVQNLGGLVQEFTRGVEQSTQVFGEVELTASDAVRAGETVAISSQNIVGSVRSTNIVMRDIADLAAKTAELTQQTLLQSEEMKKLSNELLQRIEFFQLPAAK